MNQKIHLQPIDRMLLHEYYKGFVMDAEIFMDMRNFREYTYAPERVDAYFDRLQSQKDRVDFLIMNAEKPIGEIALKHIDETTRQCELSIHLQNDSVKNKGYGTQAERLILDYAFQTLGMTAVIADSVLKNKRSQHTLEKVGFQETDRDDTFVYYRISQSDWLKLISMFDCAGFIQAVLKQNRTEIRSYFADDAAINWHCTNECFTVDEYIIANCEYPGKWDGEIETVHEADDLFVVVTKVYPKDRTASFHCVSFIRCRNGKIASLDEYWADDGAPPKWRSDMKIGKPISEERI